MAACAVSDFPRNPPHPRSWTESPLFPEAPRSAADYARVTSSTRGR